MNYDTSEAYAAQAKAAAHQTQLAQAASQAGSYAEPASRPPGVLDAAIENHHGIAQRLNGAIERLERACDRLLGPQGQTPAPNAPGAMVKPGFPVGGQVGELAQIHDGINHHFGRLFDVIERVERL